MKMIVWGLLCLATAGIFMAWTPPLTLWQWKVSLVVLELGHWLALIVLGLGIWALWQNQKLACASALVVAGVLLSPAILAAWTVPEFSWRRLYTPAFRQADPEHRVYWQKGQEQLDIVVYRPTEQKPDMPCLLILHSGGWEHGDPSEFAATNQAIAERGIIVLSAGYRLAPRYPWLAQRQDVELAIQWARERVEELNIDPEKLFLMGRSAGGQIATACAYGMPELGLRGCIALYAPHDMRFAHQYSREDDILNALKLLRQYLGGDPETAAENYASASAYTMVSPQSPPTLLMHGPRDALVWVLQSRRLAAKLREAGVRYDYHELPWAVHACDYFSTSPGGQAVVLAVGDFVHALSR